VTDRFDAVIAGGGPAGLTMALALAHIFKDDTRIAIVDPSVASAGNRDDPRAWALSAASVRLLDRLGVWQAVKPYAQSVDQIEITDSALEAGIRPVLLCYDNHTPEGEPAAHIVPNQALLRALSTTVASKDQNIIHYFRGRSITSSQQGPAGNTAVLDDRSTLASDLIIAADGRNSQLREAAHIETVQWSYEQIGIVTTVNHERPHDGKAVQHFLPGGPFAILPLPGNSSCITWSEDAKTGQRIMKLGDEDFLVEVQSRFGGKLGALAAGGRGSFPLGMHLARQFIAPRLCLIGDAAHVVHPIAGQGLNLGFRDIAALAQCIADGARNGMPFGDVTVLERYQAWRRFDSTLSAATFDSINRLFSNDITLLRSAREVGLGLIDRLPELKRFFVNEAAGLSGEIPKLMRRP